MATYPYAATLLKRLVDKGVIRKQERGKGTTYQIAAGAKKHICRAVAIHGNRKDQ